MTPARSGAKWSEREWNIGARLVRKYGYARTATRLKRSLEAIRGSFSGLERIGKRGLKPSRARIDDLARRFAIELKIGRDLILSKSHKPGPARARWLMYKVLREEGFSFPGIGLAMGVHHTTVLYGLRRLAGTPASQKSRSQR